MDELRNTIIEFLRNFVEEQKQEYGTGTYTAPWLETLNLHFNEMWWATGVLLVIVLFYLFNDFFRNNYRKKK